MQISRTVQKPQAASVQRAAREASPSEKEQSSSGGVRDFYEKNKTAIHLGGGALLGAGIAMYGAGLTGTEVMSAAGSGALGGFFAGNDSQRALYMGGGAVLGATIAGMAGVPGAAVLSAAGTGAVLGFLFA